MTTTAPPACDHHWHAGACLTDDLPPQPVTEPHECRQPAGHPPPCRCHWCGTTAAARTGRGHRTRGGSRVIEPEAGLHSEPEIESKPAAALDPQARKET